MLMLSAFSDVGKCPSELLRVGVCVCVGVGVCTDGVSSRGRDFRHEAEAAEGVQTLRAQRSSAHWTVRPRCMPPHNILLGL